MSEGYDEKVDALGNFIMTERDKFPRDYRDGDSWVLAGQILDFLKEQESRKKSDYILATPENIRALVVKEFSVTKEKLEALAAWLIQNK